MGPQDEENETFDQFVARRRREKAGAGAARASAHRDYGRSIRNDKNLDLRRPSDLASYGVGPSSRPKAVYDLGGTAPSGDVIPEPILQADSAIRAAANAATFGGADKFAAAMEALDGGVNGWRQRYKANLQHEQARNDYDAVNRHFAQSVGTVGGGVLGLAALGPGRAMVTGAARLPGSAALTAKEARSILGLGALGGGTIQAASDLASGHFSSPADIAGAAAGGVAAAAAWPAGPARAGAIDGAVTSAMQDFLNGRPVSLPQMVQTALGGSFVGRVGGHVGRKWSDGLSSTAKGKLGEALGDMRSSLNGQPRWSGRQVAAPVKPGQTVALKGKQTYWKPDGLAGPPPTEPHLEWPDMFEDKFGYHAGLTPNQKMAQANWGPQFRLNHFTPDDVGLMTGVSAAWFLPPGVGQVQRKGR